MVNIRDFMKSGELFDARYKILTPLNMEGGTADVWLAIDMNTVGISLDEEDENATPDENEGVRVAIKVYRPKNTLDIEGEERFRKEYKIVFNCHHTNLLQPINFSIFKGTPYLVMPYFKNGSSEKLVGKMNDNRQLWKYIYDVAAGLAKLHSNNPTIVHLDMKPANVLIGDDGNFCITDFGISSESGSKTGERDGEEISGTFPYMAPERFLENIKPQKESDIWAFGATLYELITGNPPFGSNGGERQPYVEVKFSLADYGIDPEIEKIINKCLDPDPAQRPTAAQIEMKAGTMVFPVNRKMAPWTKVALALGFVALAVGAFFLFFNSEKEEVVVKTKPVEVQYDRALALLDSDIPDSVKLGAEKMEKLANDSNYIPAAYQMAVTYGCYSRPEAIKRKDLLGIKYGNEYINKQYVKGETRIHTELLHKYMPISDEINVMAERFFISIIKTSDSIYLPQKMDAYFRLGLYNLFFKNIKDKGISYLEEAEKIAIQLGDKTNETNYSNIIDGWK